MKTKIVLWGEQGENETLEKILLAIELVEAENLVRIHKVSASIATEAFYNQMMNQWRQGQVVQLPEGTETIDRALSMTEGLLPDNIRTDRQDIIARAKTEWHFVILSSKLYEAYADEIQEIKERIDELKDFDGAIWEEMKSFWKKVQDQVHEKNLFREHASDLRSKTDGLFETLKGLKRAMNDEFERTSKDHLDKFSVMLNDIEERIEKGLGLQPIFNELKNVQSTFSNTKFTRKHHNEVWKRLDNAFKKVKEKRFGDKQNKNNSALSRVTRRYDGLLNAIGKMEKSIARDVKDKEFQIKRINTTDGQLELQIRQAKMAMIEERMSSKQVKLDDMLKIKGELERKIESEKVRAEKLEHKKIEQAKLKEAKSAAKDNIAQGIEKRNAELAKEKGKLEKAAEAIALGKKKSRASKEQSPIPVEIQADSTAQEEDKNKEAADAKLTVDPEGTAVKEDPKVEVTGEDKPPKTESSAPVKDVIEDEPKEAAPQTEVTVESKAPKEEVVAKEQEDVSKEDEPKTDSGVDKEAKKESSLPQSTNKDSSEAEVSDTSKEAAQEALKETDPIGEEIKEAALATAVVQMPIELSKSNNEGEKAAAAEEVAASISGADQIASDIDDATPILTTIDEEE